MSLYPIYLLCFPIWETKKNGFQSLFIHQDFSILNNKDFII